MTACGQGEARNLGESVQQRAQQAVVGAEVVAPFGDAVRLVDREQANLGAAQQFTKVRLAGVRNFFKILPKQPNLLFAFGTKDVTGEPIGGEIPLELLDEVLGLAALVILGEHVRAAAPVRDDEADVGPLRGVLDHREHTPGPRPAAGLVADARN